MLTRILDLTLKSSLPTDLGRVVQIKLSRRAWKLGSALLDHVQTRTIQTCEKITSVHKKAWQEAQKRDAERSTQIDVSTLEKDMALKLRNCRPHLDAAMLFSSQDTQTSNAKLPQFARWIHIQEDGLPSMEDVPTDEIIYVLAEVEQWVARSLPSWVNQILQSPNSTHCQSVCALTGQYVRTALSTYSANPEQMSEMLLVVGVLWFAIDKICVTLTPLLAEYPPPVEKDIFYPLLLPHRAQMVRLEKLERYIRHRSMEAKSKNASVFFDPSQSASLCFAVQYYDSSPVHQNLNRRIEVGAERARFKRENEWQRKKNEYDDLTVKASGLDCNEKLDHYGYMRHDDGNCRKCDIDGQISRLSIDIYEWPLPKDDNFRKLAVFELDCPVAFASWRNVSWLLIHDLARRGKPGRDVEVTLPTYLVRFLCPLDLWKRVSTRH